MLYFAVPLYCTVLQFCGFFVRGSLLYRAHGAVIFNTVLCCAVPIVLSVRHCRLAPQLNRSCCALGSICVLSRSSHHCSVLPITTILHTCTVLLLILLCYCMLHCATQSSHHTHKPTAINAIHSKQHMSITVLRCALQYCIVLYCNI